MLEDLRTLVELESPSDDKQLLDAGSPRSRWLVDRAGEPDESTATTAARTATCWR